MADEIDHRVIKSLQFVSACWRCGAAHPTSARQQSHLPMTANRVATVAQKHRHFYADGADGADEASSIAFL